MTLTFEDNGTAHNDLVLRIGDLVWRCDSYFLALDEGVLPKQGDAAKVRAVLRALLQSWRAAIASLANGATAYLVYDFSDQGTGWLACQMIDGALLVRHGWADVEGWAISPSAPPAPRGKPSGFQPDGEPLRIAVDDFVGGIGRSIEAAA